ncbi:3,4-dihydroxy-2-butanone-4-phosphate synthase [Prauserella sp. PE36]|uniref:3,4-dihydroxy-2-butanone-4-phosphate synthase n=1 Tax=Prauserella sp. PE36 TaxID=1504709 RepID=UPI0018F396F7|nr:3,4-dihydroxy-2-butanone-4-phosphate synthase [Prauserella sp. PE36]
MVNYSVCPPLDGLSAAVRALASGGMAVLVADGVGYLTMAAEHADWRRISFFVRHTSGFLRVAMRSDRADRLELPPMVPRWRDRAETEFAVSVDASDGVSTGISARDRARTVRLLAGPATTPDAFSRPGHVMPVRTHRDGVLGRAQAPEAAVDLCRLAGVAPVAVLCELIAADGSLAEHPTLVDFTREHDLPALSVQLVVTRMEETMGIDRARSREEWSVQRPRGFLAKAPLSAVIRAGDLIITSGQIGIDDTGAVVPGIGPQTRVCLENIATLLASSGASLTDVVQTRVYLTDFNGYDDFNGVYREFFEDPYPTRSTIGVPQLALGAEIEIEAVAIRPHATEPSGEADD